MGSARVAVIDYEAGNLRSISRALALAGAEVSLPAVPPRGERFDLVVLPGVGAFGMAMRRLAAAGLPEWIRAQVASGTPLLGVCLGMQLLYEGSDEARGEPGLGLLRGWVRRLPPGLKVPHMGWNQLSVLKPTAAVEGLADGTNVYFVHSYVVDPQDLTDVVAVTSYGVEFPAVVQSGIVTGVQFHPEKSGDAGRRLLANVIAAATGARHSAAV